MLYLFWHRPCTEFTWIGQWEEKKIASSNSSPEQAIVLFHGMNKSSREFRIMEEKLAYAFPKAKIIALESVNKQAHKNRFLNPAPTLTLSIHEQADLAYKEIKKKVAKGTELVLIGHSQGGLRAFTMVAQYFKKLQDEEQMVIKQLITIATPWKGAPAIKHIYSRQHRDKAKLNTVVAMLSKIEEGLDKQASYRFVPIPQMVKYLVKYFHHNFPWLYNYLVRNWIERKMPGVVDLTPESPFITHYVAKKLPTFPIPIKAIASVSVDFSQLLHPFLIHFTKNELFLLNSTYAELIGGSADCEHDMVLPIDTQHAIGMEKNDFVCIKVAGACHGNKLGIPNKKGISIIRVPIHLPQLNHEKIIKQVIALIDSSFYD